MQKTSWQPRAPSRAARPPAPVETPRSPRQPSRRHCPRSHRAQTEPHQTESEQACKSRRTSSARASHSAHPPWRATWTPPKQCARQSRKSRRLRGETTQRGAARSAAPLSPWARTRPPRRPRRSRRRYHRRRHLLRRRKHRAPPCAFSRARSA